MFTHDSKGTVVLQPDLERALFGKSTPERVLIVDDDPTTAQLLSAMGEKEGYRVVSVDDARKAYRILKLDANFAAAVFNMAAPNLKGGGIIPGMENEKRPIRSSWGRVARDHRPDHITESVAAG